MKDFWRGHTWPAGERRYHWLVVFDDQPAVAQCHAAHAEVLAPYRSLVDPVPARWLHLTLQSLCATTAATDAELARLREAVAEVLTETPPAQVQLGPARLDGAAVSWAVYPEPELVQIQRRVREASIAVLGEDRVAPPRRRWWPHITLGYGARDEPADEELAAALAQAGLPRVTATIDTVTLVDEQQDLSAREFRWRKLAGVPIGPGTPYAASL